LRDGYTIAKNILQGKQAQSDGAFFERMIDEACFRYKCNGWANVEKTPEPMKAIKPMGRGQFLAHYLSKAQPDFKGVLGGGRAVMFEAKSTNADRILQSRVMDNQLQALLDYKEFNALTFILIFFLTENACFRIPVETWRDMKQIFGRKYIKADELEDYRVPTSGMRVDFLKTEDIENGD